MALSAFVCLIHWEDESEGISKLVFVSVSGLECKWSCSLCMVHNPQRPNLVRILLQMLK